MTALRYSLFGLLLLAALVHGQKQGFALADKNGQENFAYDGPLLLADRFAKRGQRFAYESDAAVPSGRFAKFAKMLPDGRRDFAFAFAKRANFAFGPTNE